MWCDNAYIEWTELARMYRNGRGYPIIYTVNILDKDGLLWHTVQKTLKY